MAFTVSIDVPSPVLKTLDSLELGAMFIQETDLDVHAPLAYVVSDAKSPNGDVPCLVMSQGQNAWMPITLPGSVRVAKLLNVAMTATVEIA